MSVEAPIQGLDLRLGPELSTTPVAGANDTVVGTANRYYSFLTLPTSAPLYTITGLEWLNGTVVSGNVMAHLEIVDANLPTSNNTTMLVWSRLVAQSGAGAVQRNNDFHPCIVLGGIILGASIVSSSATARFGTSTVAAGNRLRALTLTADPNMGNTTAWASGTEEPYIKIYYKGLF